MDRDLLLMRLAELADELRTERTSGRIYVVGGAAMILAYDSERATRDIDSVVLQGHGPVIAAARKIGRRHGLPSTWLNEQASVYVPTQPDSGARVVFDHPNLRVIAASPDRILAMKARAARQADVEDLKQLITLLGLRSANEVVDLTRRYFPQEDLPRRNILMIEDLMATLDG